MELLGRRLDIPEGRNQGRWGLEGHEFGPVVVEVMDTPVQAESGAEGEEACGNPAKLEG